MRNGSLVRASHIVRNLPILIVGGGVAGFTAALSLHRAGISNRLLMAEKKFTEHARSGIFLGGSAVRILDRLGLGPQYRALGTPMYHVQFEDVSGRKIYSLNLDEYGMEVWTVPREQLKQRFLEAIPPNSVHTETRFRSLAIHEDYVSVKVEQKPSDLVNFGIRPITDFETDFVIGADGLNSAVRMFMARPVMTSPSGVFVWRAVVRNQDLEKYPRHAGKEVWDINRRFGFTRMTRDEVVWWAVVTDFDEVLLRPFTPHLLRLFSKFPHHVLDLISSVDTDRSISRVEMKRVYPERFPWVDPNSSRIALVGDAGRPANTGNFHTRHMFAVEDSYLLANCLAEQKGKKMLVTSSSLHNYECSREERMNMSETVFDRFNSLSTSRSSFRRYIAKSRLVIAMSRLALRTGESTIPMISQ